MDRTVRWTVDLCLCDVSEGEEWVNLFDCFDDEPAARHVYDTLVSLNLNWSYTIFLHRQDRVGIGWSKAVQVARSDEEEDGITFEAAQGLARKLYANHGHNVLLSNGKDFIPFGAVAEARLQNPPPRLPVEIRRSNLSPELFDPVPKIL